MFSRLAQIYRVAGKRYVFRTAAMSGAIFGAFAGAAMLSKGPTLSQLLLDSNQVGEAFDAATSKVIKKKLVLVTGPMEVGKVCLPLKSVLLYL